MKPEDLLKNQPIEYSTIYIDMNSFFASVEQFYNPDLRGRPVAVSTAPSGGGSIVAASIEAKRTGIKTGTKVSEAYRLCPEVVVVHDSPNSYRKIHREIMDILHATPCYVRAKSIDEAYLKVPSYLQSRKGVEKLIQAIKSELFGLYGNSILCSAGVASNIWLAKMASNSQKPNGKVILNASKLEDFYKTLCLTDLTGINFRMARQLYAVGIQNPYDLYLSSWRFLNKKLGINGGKWYLRLRGFEVDVDKLKANKSISHQITTMPNPPTKLVEITTYVNKIAVNLGKRLRHKELGATGIAIFVAFNNGQYWGNAYKKVAIFRSDYEIIKLSQMLLKKLNFLPDSVRKVSITLFNLSESRQMAIDWGDGMAKYLALSNAIDEINTRYGGGTIMPLRSHNAEHVNLNRVGFAGDLIREKINPTDKHYYH
jgi:DNA polymerase-4